MAKALHADVPEGAAQRYERVAAPIMAPFVTALLDAAEIQPGGDVLDLACGTGFAARGAAERTGPTGSVVGLDRSAAMIDEAGRHGGGYAITWVQGDAENLPFPPGSFTTVVCQQGLQFMTDVRQVALEVQRVLRGDGSLAATIWQPLERSPCAAAEARALERVAGPDAAAQVRWAFGASVDAIVHDVRAAGMLEVRAEEIVADVRLPATLDAVGERIELELWGGGAARLAPQQVREVAALVLEDLADLVTDDGTLVAPFAAVVVRAYP